MELVGVLVVMVAAYFVGAWHGVSKVRSRRLAEEKELVELAREAFRRHDEARKVWESVIDADTGLLNAVVLERREHIAEAKNAARIARDHAQAAHVVAREALGRLTHRLGV